LRCLDVNIQPTNGTGDAEMFEQLIPYTPYLALLFRVVVGITMIMHGYPKLKNPKQTIEWTKGPGVPAVAARPAMIVLGAGILSIDGFLGLQTIKTASWR
jgi:uncharacterized membrane protein YphA (DoxX/SURF4 family)